jgi:hypothetical protein
LNDELKRISEEAVVVYFKVISQAAFGPGTEVKQ